MAWGSLFKHFKRYVGIFRDIDAYLATLRGEASPALFWNRKRCPEFRKKILDCVCLWIKFGRLEKSIQVKIFQNVSLQGFFYLFLMKYLSKCPSFTNQAYSAPCVTLTYLQICHILSPNLFKTESLFETHWNIDQAYLEPYHGALFSHIQAYSEPRTMLAYAEGCHTWNPGISRTFP